MKNRFSEEQIISNLKKQGSDWATPGNDSDESELHQIETYTAQIYCGLREGYDGTVHTIEEAQALVQDYVTQAGISVTVQPLTVFFPDGEEPGVLIGLINYPRFPSSPQAIREHAFVLARRLKSAFKQERLTVICSDYTYLLGSKG